jgi:hypothetical protein
MINGVSLKTKIYEWKFYWNAITKLVEILSYILIENIHICSLVIQQCLEKTSEEDCANKSAKGEY